MQYNYDFEIAALVVMTIVLLHFLFVRQFPTEKAKTYFKLLLVCIGECVFNILSCIGLADAAVVPEYWNEFSICQSKGRCNVKSAL